MKWVYRLCFAALAAVLLLPVAHKAEAQSLAITGPTALTETDADFASGAYTVTRSGAAFTAASTEITLTVTHTSTDTADVTVPASVTFAPGDDTQTFTVTVTGDNLNEATETFTVVTSGGGSSVTHGAAFATTIADDDDITYRVSGSATVSEGDGSVDFIFTLSGPSQGMVEVLVRQIGTAVDITSVSDGVPYDISGTRGISNTLRVFNAGNTTNTMTVTLNDDMLNESDETIIIELVPGSSGHRTSGGAGRVALDPNPANQSATTTITDNDPITVSIARHSSTPATIDEGGTATFTFSLGVPSAGVVTVPYTVTNTTASYMPVDSGDGSIDFAAGATSQDITLMMPVDPALGSTEPDGTVTVTLGAASVAAPGGGTVTSSGMATVTVNYIDARTLTVTGPPTIAEGAADVESSDYTVALTRANFSATTAVTWTVAHGATEDADFVDASDRSGTLMFGTTDTSLTFTLTVAADMLNEADEGFTVNISVADPDADDGTTYGAAHATTITDAAEDAITVTIALATGAPTTVDEGGTATFTATLTVPSAGVVTLPYTVSGTTDTPTDANSGSIAIPAGQTTGDIVLGIPPNTALGSSDPDETLTVTLGAASVDALGGTVTSTGTATVLVNYVDAAHTISFASSAATALAEGAAATTYTVTRTGPDIASGASIVVSWTYTAGSTAAADFTGGAPAGGALTFAGMETEKTFEIAVADDTDSEPDETFTLGLSADPGVLTSNGGVELGADVSVTIGASDRPVTLSVAPPAGGLTEGTAADFTVSFPELVTTTAPVMVDWAIEFPAASAMVNPAAAADFTITQSGTASIAAGAASANIAITAAADMLNEAAERFSVRLSNPRGGGAIAAPVLHASNNAASAEIAASDPVTVSIELATGAPTTVDEGDTATFTFSLGVPSAGVVTVPYTVANTTASYTPVDSGSGSIDFAAGETSQNITLMMPVDPALDSTEPDGTVTVTLGAASVEAPGGGTVTSTGSATVTVNYVDAAHTIFFASPAMALAEGAAATTYTVTRTGPAIVGGASIVVSWTYTAGSTNPTAAADFTGGAPSGGALTFVGNETEKTFEIAVADDTESEPDETFTLGLTADPGVLISNGGVELGADVSVTIGESDQPVTLAVAAPLGGLTEGTAENFTVSFPESVTTTEAVEVDWAIEFPAASAMVNPAAAADFTIMQSGTASIAAGAASANIPITAAADMLNEAAERFSVRLSNPRGGGAIAAPVLHASNNADSAEIAASDPITVSIALATGAPTTVNEGGTATFTATLNVASAGVVTVPYTVSGTTDTPTDANSGSIAIPAGQTTGDIVLGIPGSTALGSSDPDETLTVTLGTASVASPGGTVTSTGTATVQVNYLSAAHSIFFASPATALAEGGAATTYTVTRNGPDIAGGASIVVSWTYTAGAAAAADFTGGAPAGGTFTFVGSETEKTFEIAVADDADSEPDETFTLGLTAEASVLAANGGVALGGDVVVTIGASDRPVTLSVTGPLGGLTEGTAADFAVSFAETVTTSAPVTVGWAISFPDPAPSTVPAAAADFAGSALSGMVSIAAGESSANIAITAAADSLNEAEESFIVTLSAPAGGGAIAAPVLHASNNAASAEIAASDPITVSIARASGAPATVDEGGTAVFTFSLNFASAGVVTVPYTVMSDSTPPYTPTDSGGGSLTFAASATTQNITLTLPNSPTHGSMTTGNTLTVTLGSASVAPGGGTVTSTGSATVMVNFRDNAHNITFASPATALAEGGAATTYTVTRTGPAIAGGASIVVSWTYAASSAAAADFIGGAPAGGAFTFVGNETEKSFEIAVADDTESEPDETFTLGLTAEASVLAANGGVALGGDVTVTIGASDRPVTLSVDPPAGGLTEGAAANFAVSFAETVTTSAPVTVGWAISFPDPAPSTVPAEAADFAGSALSGTASIAAGATSANIAITAAADMLNEAEESFTVTLSSPAGGGAIAAPVLAATASAATTIAASDPVTVSLARASGESGEVSEGGTVTFTATLSGASAGPVRVAYEITLGGAAPGARIADAGGGSVAVAAGALSADIAITINADLVRNMGTEPLAISISTVTPEAGAGSATAGSPNSASATVRYVAAQRTLEVSAASAGSEDSVTAAGETAFADFTARMSGEPLVEAVMVDWTLEGADGANLPGTSGASGLARNHGGDHTPDFGAATIAEPGGGAVNADGRSGTLVFPLGALVARTIRVPVLQDALNEGAERLTLRLMNPCPSSGVCRVGGGSDTIPTLQLGTAAQTATILASDPIVLSVARDGTGAVVSGQDITYSVRFGTATVNGVPTPIAPSAPLMVSLPLRVNGAASGVSVAATAAAGAAALTISVPAAQVAAAVDAVAPTGTPTVSLGAPVVSGAPDPAMVSVPQPGDAANPLPAPVQTSDWILARTLPGGDQAPEGLSYRVVFELRGSETPTDLFFTWQVAASGDNSAVAGDFGGSAAYSCGSTSATTPCTGFPGGRVEFAAGDSSREISIVIFDDSGAADGGVEGTQPEGFALTISALSGTDAGQVRYADAASDLSSAVTLQASIPALRVDLSLAGATADEGGDAVFWLTLGNFSGGAATLSPISVRYALVDGSAAAGADYTPPAELVTQIPAGSAEGARHAIAVALVADGVVEPPETFALTIARMDVSGGGGVVRLVDASGAEQASLSATGTITGAGDAARRRQQRVGALATVLDRQTALLATDAITARLARTQSGSGGGAELSIANRNLLGARAASAANGGSAGAASGGAAGGGAVSTGAQSTDSADTELGLALYGAAGLGGAAAGLPGGAAGAGGMAAGLAGGTAAGAGFGGLGAGLAGGANMGSRTALPNLAQLLGGSRFAFNVSWRDLPKRAAALASGVQVWGSGGFAELRGGPEAGLSYKGDTAAAFLGADVPVRDNLLAGLALGWTGGELDFTDRAGDFTTSGEFRNDGLSVHPYLGWQISDHAKAWLVLGFGAGSVEIDESDSSGNSRSLNSGGSDMRMFSAGIAGEQPFSEATNLRLRFAITRVQSRVDLGVFDDGALLPKARGRSLRVGGEAEVGHRIIFANGLLLRPFGTLGLRLDNTGAASGIENESFDWGGGLQAAWPALGLDGRFAFTRQLNDTGHDEQRMSATVNFDPGADSQGFTLAMQTAMQSSTPGAGAFGNTFGASASSAFGAGASGGFGAGGALGVGGSASGAFGNAPGAGAGEMQQSLSGEIAYAMAFRLRQSGRSGWLTPYARFALRSANTRWAAGLRLAEPRSALQVGLEAALDRNSRNPANSTGTTTTGSDYNLLLTGQLRF